MKRRIAVCLLVALALLMASSASAASVGNLIRYVPTEIQVEYNKVTVEGYFVNLNSNYDVKNFREFEMSVYRNGTLLSKGSFGTINEFTVYAMGTAYQSFTFNGSHNLNYGTYECDDNYYCTFSCRFTQVG